MKPSALTLILAALAATACGGRALEEPGSGGSGSGDPSSSGSQAATAGQSSASSPSLPTHALGDCTPGFPRGADPDHKCNWVTKNNICFADKDSACACICPTSGDSVCFSGFDGGPGSATLVQCL